MAVETGSTSTVEKPSSSRSGTVGKSVSGFLDRVRHSWVIPGEVHMHGTSSGHTSVAYENNDDHEVLSIQLMTLPRKAIIFRDKRSKGDPERIGDCVIFSRINQKGKTDSIMNTPRAVWEAGVLVGLCDI